MHGAGAVAGAPFALSRLGGVAGAGPPARCPGAQGGPGYGRGLGGGCFSASAQTGGLEWSKLKNSKSNGKHGIFTPGRSEVSKNHKTGAMGPKMAICEKMGKSTKIAKFRIVLEKVRFPVYLRKEVEKKIFEF